MHEELGLLVGAGLTPYQALHAATAAPADWLRDRAIGRIEVGARADLVLLDADPRNDITATTRRSGVMVRGAWSTQPQLDARLEALAASYTQPIERFAGRPALTPPPGEVLLAATYHATLSNVVVGEERLVIVRGQDGGRIIVGQAAGDPPSPKFAQVREELDAAGKLRTFSIEEDGKAATATLTAGKLRVTATTGADVDAAPDLLLDANFVATMIPFIARAKPGRRLEIRGKTLGGDGKLTEVRYVLDRTGERFTFVVTSGYGDAPGSIELDAAGFPRIIRLEIGPAELVVTRQ
jgi:Amidohydrolase family